MTRLDSKLRGQVALKIIKASLFLLKGFRIDQLSAVAGSMSSTRSFVAITIDGENTRRIYIDRRWKIGFLTVRETDCYELTSKHSKSCEVFETRMFLNKYFF